MVFSDEGLISASFFYKDLINWTDNGTSIQDFSEFYIPGGFHDDSNNEPPKLSTGLVSNRMDGLKGFVRGQEYSAVLPLTLLSTTLDGLGLITSATFTKGGLNNGTRVPGLSNEIYQFTLFYQNSGFEMRLSGRKRDKFQSETRGGSLSLTPALDEGAELWDAQIAYDFSESRFSSLEGLKVTLQGQNLTDEDTDLRDSSGNIEQYQAFGPNYLLGFSYKF